MSRSITIVFICIFFLLLLPSERTFIPVFLINEKPDVITKGHNNNAFLVLVNFEHEELQSFIKGTEPYSITYFVSAELLERSPLLVKTLKQVKPLLGLYGATNEQYENNTPLLQKQLKTFTALLGFTPMYFMTEDASYSQQLLNTLTKQQINAIAPTQSYSPSIDLTKGQFIYVKLHKDSSVNWQELQRFVKKHSFVSIEDTIFDATISSESAP